MIEEGGTGPQRGFSDPSSQVNCVIALVNCHSAHINIIQRTASVSTSSSAPGFTPSYAPGFTPVLSTGNLKQSVE